VSDYTPPQEILERYAALLVGYGIGAGKGMKEGEVVSVVSWEAAKPLMYHVCREIWRRGGHVIQTFRPADDSDYNLSKAFFELATEEQLAFAPLKSSIARIEEADHIIFLIGERDPHALDGVDPAKMMAQGRAGRPIFEARQAKEAAGKQTWTIGNYGTPGMAAEARMGIEQYWEQMIKGCRLDDPDPVARWLEIAEQIKHYTDWLNALEIERVHIKGADADLWITLGPERKFVAADGCNIPSYEIYTAPDYRGTNGWIRFNEPIYLYGPMLEGVELEFKDGDVVRASATENEQLLQELVATDEGAGRLGEFSMTDSRLSPITAFMADTLYDENRGGRYGNSHIALGSTIQEAYTGDAEAMTDEDWKRLGFNSSGVHTDFIQTTDRTITAVLADGSELVIYADGQFTL